VPLRLGDLSYMTQGVYRRWMAGLIETSVTWQWHSEPLASWAQRNVRDARPILALYRSENYVSLANRLNIWPYPRGHHRFATVIYAEGRTVVLADERQGRQLLCHSHVAR
jgi:hypothetical protein